MQIKRLVKTLAVATLGALGFPSAALADWQYTKWGMNEAAFKAAAAKSNIPLEAVEKGENDYRWTGTHTAGSFVFTASFAFIEGKLARVSLLMKNGDCSDLARSLKENYGDPYATTRSELSKGVDYYFADKKNNNRLRFMDMGRHCAINYDALRNAQSKGL